MAQCRQGGNRGSARLDVRLYYYAYSPTTSSATFWPQVHDTRYRWHVRAHNAEGWGPWSAWATFRFN
jgi:hypothetical protein